MVIVCEGGRGVVGFCLQPSNRVVRASKQERWQHQYVTEHSCTQIPSRDADLPPFTTDDLAPWPRTNLLPLLLLRKSAPARPHRLLLFLAMRSYSKPQRHAWAHREAQSVPLSYDGPSLRASRRRLATGIGKSAHDDARRSQSILILHAARLTRAYP